MKSTQYTLMTAIAVAGLSFGLSGAAQAAVVVNGVTVEATVSTGGATGAGFGITDLSGLADWNLFGGTSITTPVEEKAGASILGNYVAGGIGISAVAGGRALTFSWDDGSPTGSSGGTAVGVDTGAGAGYTGALVTWDVVLPALTGTTNGFQMTYFTNEKRYTSSLQIDDSGFTPLATEVGNDEGTIRAWTVTMRGYTGTPTLTFRHNLDVDEGTNETVFYFGNVGVSALVVPEPSTLALLLGGGVLIAAARRRTS